MISSKKLFSIPAIALFAGSMSTALMGCAVATTDESTTQRAGSISEGLSNQCAPAVPNPGLAVPDGNQLSFELDAIGKQVYECQASGSVFAWVFRYPDATLYQSGHVAGSHYIGPTWEYQDGSKVQGAKVFGFAPDPTAIPWLLLKATTHTGDDGRMSDVTYIQRLYTTGGLAPATACDAGSVGTLVGTDYTATYFFYKASSGDGPQCG